MHDIIVAILFIGTTVFNVVFIILILGQPKDPPEDNHDDFDYFDDHDDFDPYSH